MTPWPGWRAAILGALCGGMAVGATALLAHLYAPAEAFPFLASSIGSSTVVVFTLPTSPVADPWAVIGGSIVSTACGIAMGMLLGPGWFAIAAAITLAIFAMWALRCLHPPGGGYALTPLVAGHGAASMSWWFVLRPVAASCVALVLCGIAFHRLVTGHRYPLRTLAPSPAPV